MSSSHSPAAAVESRQGLYTPPLTDAPSPGVNREIPYFFRRSSHWTPFLPLDCRLLTISASLREGKSPSFAGDGNRDSRQGPLRAQGSLGAPVQMLLKRQSQREHAPSPALPGEGAGRGGRASARATDTVPFPQPFNACFPDTAKGMLLGRSLSQPKSKGALKASRV